jgi:hypothetical protein
MLHSWIDYIFSLRVRLAAMLNEGPVDVAAVGILSYSPDIIGGDG